MKTFLVDHAKQRLLGVGDSTCATAFANCTTAVEVDKLAELLPSPTLFWANTIGEFLDSARSANALAEQQLKRWSRYLHRAMCDFSTDEGENRENKPL